MSKLNLFFICFFCVLRATAQNKTITYRESMEELLNPERGFYIPVETKASKFVLLDTARLKAFRNSPQQLRKSTFAVQVTLLYRSYELDSFKNQPLSESFLINLEKDFEAVRTAGLKMILRFAYTNTSKSGNCGDEYNICPPYGDAPRNIVLHHISQLKPVLQKNADVIAALQEGFIGIWGENYFTDYFGDASNSGAGKILDSSWLHRNELLKALLNALPASRMVQVRTPQIKQKFLYGPSATIESAPLTSAAAFNNSDASRIGFHNDCFLASPDDYGTYYDYGSSTQPRQAANAALRKFIQADTKFTVVGGETCDDAFSPQNDCAPAGHAEEEMNNMHYSYLNAAYNKDVNNDWDSGGCINSIKRKLGYRLVLRNALFPSTIKQNGSLALDMQMENKGYASPYNPRPVKIIFRNTKTNKEFMITLKEDPRFWFTGSHHIKELLNLPPQMEQGNYQLLIALPDASVTLEKRPEYAIRLANENVWEPATGYNDLHYIVQVQ